MAQEQLELKKSLAKKEEERIPHEQMNNEELVSTPTCFHTQRLPIIPLSSTLPDNITKSANHLPVNSGVSCNHTSSSSGD